LEVSSIELLPDGKLALGTRRGEIWTAANVGDADPSKVQYQLFASGQHEVLGLAFKDNALFATNRYEIVRITDENGDGRGDVFKTSTRLALPLIRAATSGWCSASRAPLAAAPISEAGRCA
jgi:hypothetical protein